MREIGTVIFETEFFSVTLPFRVLVSGGNSSYTFFCDDLVSLISSPLPQAAASLLLLVAPILIFLLPLTPGLKTLAHHRPLLLLLPITSSLVISPLHCCPCPPSHLALNLALSLFSATITTATIVSCIILTFAPSILHLLIGVASLLSCVTLLALVYLHRQANKKTVLNLEDLDEKFVRLKIKV